MDLHDASLGQDNVRRMTFSDVEMAFTRRTTGLSKNAVDELLDGAIDIHIHAAPDVSVRMWDEIDIAIQACKAKLRAIVFKQQAAPTACRTPLVQKVVNQWAKDHNLHAPQVLGGVALNYAVGGLNPEAVIAAADYGGKFVWLPVKDSSHHRRILGKTGGIAVLDQNGNVVPELLDILKIISERDLVLALAHQSVAERWKIAQEARALGVKRILADHPQWPATKMTHSQMREFAGLGVYLGMYWVAAAPNFRNPNVDPREVLEIIRAVGVEQLVGGTDLTQPGNPSPVEGLRLFLEMLLAMGVPADCIRTIFARNAARLIFE